MIWSHILREKSRFLNQSYSILVKSDTNCVFNAKLNTATIAQ